jgi:hypothetical protein
MTVAVALRKPRRSIRSGAYLCSGALLLSASLALLLPAAASASTLPAAAYLNTITLTKNSSQTVTPSSSSSPTSLPLLTDSFGNSGSTTNNYSIPSLSAQATSSLCPFIGTCTANAFDRLTYSIRFATPTGTGSLPISVGVQASTTLFSSNGDFADYIAQVSITGGSGTVLFLNAPATGTGGTSSVNSSFSFIENQIYTVFMEVEVDPSGGANGFGSADPIFTPPLFDSAGAGITLETSDGIGNNSLVGTTPIPAALPLFATGIGGLGLLGWRRKRKNAAAIAAA